MVLSGKLHVYKWTCHMFPTVLVLFLSCRQPCHVHIQHILQSRRFRMTCIGGTYTHGEFSQASHFLLLHIYLQREPLRRYTLVGTNFYLGWIPVELKELLSSFEVKLDLDAVMKCAGQKWREWRHHGSRVFIRVKGMDLFPGTRHLLSGLTNSSKGWVAYPQIAWLGNLSMLKIQNGWEFRFVSRWGSKSSIWNGVILW